MRMTIKLRLLSSRRLSVTGTMIKWRRRRGAAAVLRRQEK
jgi:hypothetical protein